MRNNVKLEEAQDLIIEFIKPLLTEDISIIESLHRVLARGISADRDLPPVQQSAVDGYALGKASVTLDSRFNLTGRLNLGEVSNNYLSMDEAIGVLTGGDLPAGAEAVIPWEKAEIFDNKLTIKEIAKPGMNIKQAGEDFHYDELLAHANRRIEPADIGLLAAFGIRQVTVYRRPRVAILGLGNNVVPYHTVPERGQTRDCNGPMLGALAKLTGAEVVAIEVAGQKSVQEKKVILHDLIEKVDLVMVTGGTYAGQDAEALFLMQEAGVDPKYWGVDLQPGSHQGFGCYGDKLLFALSGNPAACAVGYHLTVAPALRMMQAIRPLPTKVPARCLNGFDKKTGIRRFVRGFAACTINGWEVTVLPGQKPSMLRSLINCNALIDLPVGHASVEAGGDVTILLLTEDIKL